MKRLIIHTVFCLCVAAAAAQEKNTLPGPDTSAIFIDPVKIVVSHPDEGSKKVRIDSLAMKTSQGKTVADVLQNSGTVYIKQYAPGQLSTISMRGSNSSQVQLMWNGFNLNNLSLGQTDFSLVPATLFSGITVNMGAMGASAGNGVIAGSVTLDNQHTGETSLMAGVQAGSFGKYGANGDFAHRGKKHFVSVKPFYFRADNRFTYLGNAGETVTMEHAESKMYGTLAAYHCFFKKNVLMTEVWFQESNRNIPATLFESHSFASQRDRSLRFSINHHRQKFGFFKANRLGYFNDQLDYHNTLTGIKSFSKVHNLVGETEAHWRKKGNDHKLRLFGSAALADNSGFETQGKTMIRYSLGYFFTHTFDDKQPLHFSFSLREEVNNQVFSIPVAQLGLTKSVTKFLKNVQHVLVFGFNAGTVYRFPTFNDLYWSPGGNPGLQPEKGGSANLSGEWTIAPVRQKMLDRLNIGFTHYQRYMYGLIMWMPRGIAWSPQNLQEVWSRGNETTITAVFGKQLKLFSKALFNYTLSTIQKSGIANDQSIGRQLIYTPMYNANAELGLIYKGFSLSGTYAYYGYRYTSSDNYEYLEPFNLVGARLTCTKYFKTGVLDVFVSADNLLNDTYYWVAQRPALPRNYNAGISFKWVEKHEHINQIK